MLKVKFLGAMAAIAALIALPLASSASQDVKIESHLNVANVTAGNTNYVKSVNAKVDEVVKVELYYHNTELPNSGKVANSIHANIVIPNATGLTQVVSSTVKGSNTNSVSDTATINLDMARANVSYIPGSAEWRHNVGTNTNVTYRTDKISDAIVGSQGVDLGNEQPCYNFESYVTVLVRVQAPVVGIQKFVKVDHTNANFAAENTANPGDTLDYALTIKNYGNTVLKNVVVGDNLPPYLTYVSGSTKLVDSNTGVAGKVLVDGIRSGGVYVDDMAVGGSETIFLQARIAMTLPVGNHELKNVGVVKATGVTEVYNVATTHVNVTPVVTPTPIPTTVVCANIAAAPQGGVLDSLVYNFTLNTSGDNNKVTGYVFNFGDTITPVETNAITKTVTHAFAQAGTYTVNGQIKSGNGTQAQVETCSVKLTVGKPGGLVATGPEDLFGGAAGLTGLGYATRAYLRSRKSLALSLRRK